jgi:hypothetical protein
MRGYLQRLVESREMSALGASVPLRPALSSRSPVAETDQRLQVAALADALGAFAPETVMPDAGPVGESPTMPPYRTAHSTPVRARSASSSSQPAVQRYAMTAPASASAPSPAAPAAPRPEQPQSAQATDQLLPAQPRATPLPVVEGMRPLLPPVISQLSQAMPIVGKPRPLLPPIVPELSQTKPIVGEPLPLPSASLEIPARRPQPIAIEAPEPRTLGEETPLPSERVPANEIRVPPPRSAREIELTDVEPVRAPPAPQQTIVIRETIRTPAEALQKPQPAPQMLPRTAAEASVIGPLPRPEQTRARFELCLR